MICISAQLCQSLLARIKMKRLERLDVVGLLID